MRNWIRSWFGAGKKVHPKALIDDLLRQSKQQQYDDGYLTADLFSDFNGITRPSVWRRSSKQWSSFLHGRWKTIYLTARPSRTVQLA
jgi:hypothetical protein